MNPLLKYFFILLFFTTLSLSTFAQTARMETVLGNIDIELHPDVAPNTVANFLNYVNGGDYNNSFIHRNGIDRQSGNTFIVQGGGYTLVGEDPVRVNSRGQIQNEFNLSNIRGTIAMAKLQDLPDSATSEWFINNVDNTFLDTQNGGFTVFGTVTNGMDIVDSIAALGGTFINNTFSEIPLIDYSGSGSIISSLVMITDVYVLDTPFTINLGLNGNWFNQETSGQGIFLDILGGLDLGFIGWFTYDTQAPVDGAVENVGSAGHRWLTGLGDVDYDNNSITFDLTSTSGGLFDNGQSVTSTEANSYGTLTMTFTDCNNVTVDYNLIAQELSGTFSMTRVAGNVDLCERLSREAAR